MLRLTIAALKLTKISISEIVWFIFLRIYQIHVYFLKKAAFNKNQKFEHFMAKANFQN